jgi:hypothetical protein
VQQNPDRNDDDEAAGSPSHKWPPKLSAFRLFRAGIILIVMGVAGEQIIPAVGRWLFDFYGPRSGEIGFTVVLGLTQLAVNLLLPLGIAMVAGSLAVRALEPVQLKNG